MKISILKPNRRIFIWILALLLMITATGAVLTFDWNTINSFTMADASTLHYVRATVLSLDEETLTKDDTDHTRYLGTQALTVKLLEGEQQGEIISVTNYLTRSHNVHAARGQKIIISADTPTGSAPYFSVYQHDRGPAIFALLAAFVLCLVLVGRGKGLRALGGLAFTCFAIFFFLAPAIYHGLSPVAVVLLTILLSSLVSLLLLNGTSRKTVAALGGTLAGIVLAGLLFLFFSHMLHLSGYNTEAAETLLLVSQSTGLSIRWLLLAAMLISSMGAVMDVSMSIASPLSEIAAVKPEMTRKDLFLSGIAIGRDMIGTMSSTIILAFVGASLNTVLCLMSFGYQPAQLLSSDFVAIELAQGLCAAMGIVLTVPLASALSAALYRKPGKPAQR